MRNTYTNFWLFYFVSAIFWAIFGFCDFFPEPKVALGKNSLYILISQATGSIGAHYICIYIRSSFVSPMLLTEILTRVLI